MTARSSLYETRSLPRWTSHRSGSRPLSARLSVCSSWSSGFPCRYPATLYSEQISSAFFKCRAVIVARAGLPNTLLISTASVFHAWAPPTLKQHSLRWNVPTLAVPLRASLSPHREVSPILFAHPDQRPSAAASDLVSFGGSNYGNMDDSLSLAASDAEKLSGSSHDPAHLQSAQPSASSSGMDADLFRVLSNAVEELGLDWSPPEEPTRSRLDEWFLPGYRQANGQQASPFFPEVHDEITRSWRALLVLTSVDSTEEKGYDSLPPLDESVAAHLCPPTAIGWKVKATHPSKPCRKTSALAGRAYSSAGQAVSALHSMAVL